MADALAGALIERGAELVYAGLLADVGVAIFQSGFNRWLHEPANINLADRIIETAKELRAAIAPKETL